MSLPKNPCLLTDFFFSSGEEPFERFFTMVGCHGNQNSSWNSYLMEFESGPPKEHSCEISGKIKSIVSEKFFKEKVYGQTDGRMTDTMP